MPAVGRPWPSDDNDDDNDDDDDPMMMMMFANINSWDWRDMSNNYGCSADQTGGNL